jgi:mannose-6-phosphate isomerase
MEFYQAPWKLVPNKLVRYPGGREIDKFRGVSPAQDDGRPEAWVGSDTKVINAGEDSTEGYAQCVLPDGTTCFVPEALQKDPVHVLGENHVKTIGENLGFLVKLLDAQRQLGLQTHPTREYAREKFNSRFGKEESWYVIGMRDDTQEPPYVLLGFKEGVTREDFERGYDAGDITAMEQCCHKIPVQMGDTFFIEAGAPHAIGAGCFVVEVQEASDITVGAHKLRGEHTPEEEAAHKDRLLGCYHYDGRSYEGNVEHFRVPPKTIRSGSWGKEQMIIGPDQTDYFSFTRLDAKEPVKLLHTGALQIAIVLKGSAKLVWDGGSCETGKADEWMIPAGVTGLELQPGENGCSMVLCNPQGAAPKAE